MEEASTNSVDILLNAGSNPEIWMLIAGPACLLLLIIIGYAIAISFKRRREQAELTAEVEAAGIKPDSAEQLTAFSDDIPTEKLPINRQAADTPPPASDIDEILSTDKKSWVARLRNGLSKTRDNLKNSIESIFTGKTTLSSDVLEQIHEVLYRADVGVATTDKLVDKLRTKIGKDQAASWDIVSHVLKQEATEILKLSDTPLVIPEKKPWIILVVGVNGVGKTTTIGKLSAHFRAQNKTVLLAAADTFRAAAIDQLQVWGARLGVEVIAHKQGSDPAAVAYDGVKAAIARGTDVLIIDTAGRLHSKNELMDELGKIYRVIGKDLPGAPHETWLVIDATTGQNAVMQVKAFSEAAKVSGLVVTKLDGTAKGGVILGIADQFRIPVRYVGVGEKAVDLRPFVAADYAESMF
jgi:fused signal recognition particle receptor